MFNRAEIIGHLGNDPDVRHTQNGEAITTISVATTERWKDKNGERQERTEWHRVTFFGKLAEIAGEYLTKGRLVFVAGRLQTDKYTDKDGVERYATKIVGNEMKMLGGGEGGDRRGDGGGRGEREGRAPQRSQPQRSTRPAPARRAPPPEEEFPDDDVPC